MSSNLNDQENNESNVRQTSSWYCEFQCSVRKQWIWASVCTSFPNKTQCGRKKRGVRSGIPCSTRGPATSSRCGCLVLLPFSEPLFAPPWNESVFPFKCLALILWLFNSAAHCLWATSTVVWGQNQRTLGFLLSCSVFYLNLSAHVKIEIFHVTNLDVHLLLMDNKIWPLRDTYLKTTADERLRSWHSL